MRKTDLNYLVEIISRHLKSASVHYDVEKLQLSLLSSPTDISAFSIVQVYACLGVEAAVFKANFDSALKAGTTFLAQLSCDGKDSFVFVKKISEDFVIYYEGNRKTTVTADVFQSVWTGIIITLEKIKATDMCVIIAHYYIKPIMLFLFMLFMIGILLVNLSFSVHAIIDCLLDICGCILCVGVILQVKSPYCNVFDRLCASSSKFDCQSFDLEKWGRWFSKMSLGRIGTVYFVSCCFAILLSAFCVNSSAMFDLLDATSKFSLFVVLASVSYQMITRKICPLCMIIMGILAIKGFSCFQINNVWCVLSINLFLYLFVVVLMGCISLYAIEYLLDYRIKNFKHRVNELQIKRMPDVLRYFFMTKSVLPTDSNAIVLGDKEAPLTITTYLSPWCETCKKIALEMINLVNTYPSYVNWQIFLDGVRCEKVFVGNMPQLCLYTYLKSEKDISEKLEILKLWYNKKPAKNLCSKLVLSSEEIEKMLHLYNSQLDVVCQEKKVPAIWINQRKFPDCYSLKDLPYILLDLCMIYSKMEVL